MIDDFKTQVKLLEKELHRKLDEHEIVLGHAFYNFGRISELDKTRTKLDELDS